VRFKARNKIGLDVNVAVEALRECWRKRTGTMDANQRRRNSLASMPAIL
jgi:hypothetical protein